MRHARRESDAGQSLLEVVIALALFTVGVATVGLTLVDADVSSRQGVERTQATLLAREGLEAARSIRDADFDNLTAGSHGLALSAGRWTFSGASDVQDQFTRTVAVADLDIDAKRITSTVSWQFTAARPNSVVLTDDLTDWNQTQGNAGDVSAVISGMFWEPGQERLRDMTIQNDGPSTVTIDKMTVWWGGVKKLKQIRIDNANLYGPVPDASAVASGTEIDIVDFSMAAGSGAKVVNYLTFTGNVPQKDFIVKFIMTDGSTKYVLVDL
ncbi:hypothetical protein HY633_04520 [Candidatus Uhrbacteria bacterium]|nr:hypothetical protein [Candidatus Uhrbacteria bacterium]